MSKDKCVMNTPGAREAEIHTIIRQSNSPNHRQSSSATGATEQSKVSTRTNTQGIKFLRTVRALTPKNKTIYKASFSVTDNQN